MLKQSMKQQNEQMARQVVDAISQLVLPPEFKSPFTYGEKADLFFFLSMTEICSDKRKSSHDLQEDFKVDEQSLTLKRVRLLENEEGGADQFHSFKFNALENLGVIKQQPDSKQTYVHNSLYLCVQEISQQFDSIGEIEQAIDFAQMLRSKQQSQPLDKLGPRDNSIILSLNQMIQMSTVSAAQLIRLARILLTQEASSNMMNRYYSLLDALAELIKTVVRMETKKDPANPTLNTLAQDICRLIESLPRYNAAVFELLRCLTELTMQAPQFQIYFETFKSIIKSLNKFSGFDESSRQASILAVQSFARLNHPGVLEFLKQPEVQQGDWQSKWPALEEEALLKVDKLLLDQDMLHREACLNFVFYVGTKQIQVASHAKILGKLLDHLPQGRIEGEVQQNLMKIKAKMDQEILHGVSNFKFIMKTLAKAVNNWNKLSLKLIVIFVDFTVSAKMLHTSDAKRASLLFISFIDKYLLKQHQSLEMPDNLDDLFESLLLYIFDRETSDFSKMSNLIISGLQMNSLITLLTQDSYKFKQLIEGESQEANLISLFVRAIKENQKALKDHNLLQLFLKSLTSSDSIKAVLSELIVWNKPQAIFMYIIMNSIKKGEQYFEDEVVSLLNQNWKDNKSLRLGLQKYLLAHPQAKDKIFSKLDSHTRQLAQTILQ